MLTGSGKVLAALAILLVAAGAAAGYVELLVLGLSALAALVAAGAWMLARPQLEITRSIEPSRVTAGETCLGVLRLTNQAGRRSPPIVAVERVGRRVVGVAVPSLEAGAEEAIAYPIPTERRGSFIVGPLTLGHADPLRLMRVTRSFSSQTRVWVRPRTHPVPPLPAGRSRDLDGRTSETAPRGGVAFHSLREYVPGDDRRLIHWRSYARTGILMVRHHVVPDEPRLLVLLDTSEEPYSDESFEQAVEVAASLAQAGWRHHQPVELQTTAGAHAASGSDGLGFGDVLDLLAEVTVSPSTGRSARRDAGLRSLLTQGRQDEGVSVAVVTGAAHAEQLWAVRQVTSVFQNVGLVSVGGRGGLRDIPGVTAVAVRDAQEFAQVWPSVVRR